MLFSAVLSRGLSVFGAVCVRYINSVVLDIVSKVSVYRNISLPIYRIISGVLRPTSSGIPVSFMLGTGRTHRWVDVSNIEIVHIDLVFWYIGIVLSDAIPISISTAIINICVRERAFCVFCPCKTSKNRKQHHIYTQNRTEPRPTGESKTKQITTYVHSRTEKPVPAPLSSLARFFFVCCFFVFCYSCYFCFLFRFFFLFSFFLNCTNPAATKIPRTRNVFFFRLFFWGNFG